MVGRFSISGSRYLGDKFQIWKGIEIISSWIKQNIPGNEETYYIIQELEKFRPFDDICVKELDSYEFYQCKHTDGITLKKEDILGQSKIKLSLNYLYEGYKKIENEFGEQDYKLIIFTNKQKDSNLKGILEGTQFNSTIRSLSLHPNVSPENKEIIEFLKTKCSSNSNKLKKFLNRLYFQFFLSDAADFERKVKSQLQISEFVDYIQEQMEESYNSPNHQKLKIFLKNIVEHKNILIQHMKNEKPGNNSFFKDGISALTFDIWSKNADIMFPTKFIDDENRKFIIEGIRKIVRENPTKNEIMRVSGLVGVGKTRLVFETFNNDEFKDKVFYIDTKKLMNSNYYNYLLNSKDINQILIVDRCNYSQFSKIKKDFSFRDSAIKIITISYSSEKKNVNKNSFFIERMSVNKISEIIKSEYSTFTELIINKIKERSEGNPKLALIWADFILRGEESESFGLNSIPNIEFVNSLIADDLDTRSNEFIIRKKVLTYLSLKFSFGYGGTNEDNEILHWVLSKSPLPLDFNDRKRDLTNQNE